MKIIKSALVLTSLSFLVTKGYSQQVEVDSLAIGIALDEVMIQSLRKKQYADKSVYTFDQSALEKARYAKDLLGTLPTLTLDPVSNTFKSIVGGTTLFLINGIQVSDNQLRAVEPKNVLRIEYYDVAPTRWANLADQVVNIITTNPENGYVYGAEWIGAFDTGFINSSAYANFTQGKHNFSVDYSLYLRDYNNRENQNYTGYTLDNKSYGSSEFRKDKFGYTDQNIALKYTVSQDQKYTFQAGLDLGLFNSFNYTNAKSVFTVEQNSEDHGIFRHENMKYAMPTLDVYYARNITEKQELIFNVVGSHYTTDSYKLDHQWVEQTKVDVFNNQTILDTKQSGIVAELGHVYRFSGATLNSGYRFNFDQVDYDLSNMLGDTQYTTTFSQHYLYSEFVGKKNAWMYRLGASLTNLRNSNPEHTQDSWVFTPKILLGYEINNHQSIRLSSTYKPRALRSDEISSNVIQLQPNIVHTGNPYLKVQRSFINEINYSLSSSYFDFSVVALYNYHKDFVNSRYVLQQQQIALTYVNENNYQSYGAKFYGSIKPFASEVLVFKFGVSPVWESIDTIDGRVLKNNYAGNSFSINSSIKNLMLSYSFNIPVYSLSGEWLSTNENASNFFARYTLKNWTINAGMLFIGMPSEYKSKSFDASLVQKNSHTRIWNNKNMFIFGLSYDFSRGKQTQIKRSIENQTKEAATF